MTPPLNKKPSSPDPQVNRGEGRGKEIWVCLGCGRIGYDASDLLRQGCEGKPTEYVPASLLAQEREGRQEQTTRTLSWRTRAESAQKQRDEAEAQLAESRELRDGLNDALNDAVAARDEALARVSRTQKLAEKFLSRAEDAERNLRVTTEGYEIEEARATQAEAALTRIAEYLTDLSNHASDLDGLQAAENMTEIARAALHSERS